MQTDNTLTNYMLTAYNYEENTLKAYRLCFQYPECFFRKCIQYFGLRAVPHAENAGTSGPAILGCV